MYSYCQNVGKIWWLPLKISKLPHTYKEEIVLDNLINIFNCSYPKFFRTASIFRNIYLSHVKKTPCVLITFWIKNNIIENYSVSSFGFRPLPPSFSEITEPNADDKVTCVGILPHP